MNIKIKNRKNVINSIRNNIYTLSTIDEDVVKRVHAEIIFIYHKKKIMFDLLPNIDYIRKYLSILPSKFHNGKIILIFWKLELPIIERSIIEF